MKMKANELLNRYVTVLKTGTGWQCMSDNTVTYTQMDVPLVYVLKDIAEMQKEYINKIQSIEDHGEYTIAKGLLPCYIPSGTYKWQDVSDDGLVKFSGIMSIDIDAKDNDVDLDSIRKQIYELPYVLAVLKSVSGKGIYALVYVKDYQLIPKYYKYIAKLWQKKYGLNADAAAKNIARKRFVSYDDETDKWIKTDEEVTVWNLYEEDEVIEEPNNSVFDNQFNAFRNESSFAEKYARKAIWKLLDDGFSIDDFSGTNKYSTWYYIACDFKYFNDGEQMFMKFSSNSRNYNDSYNVIKKKWNNADTSKVDTYINTCIKWCGICKNRFGSHWYKN